MLKANVNFDSVKEIISAEGTRYVVLFEDGDTASFPTTDSLPSEVTSYIERAIGCNTDFTDDTQVNTYFAEDVSRHDQFNEAMEDALREYGLDDERISDILSADEGGLDYYEVYIDGFYPDDADLDLVAGCEVERLEANEVI